MKIKWPNVFHFAFRAGVFIKGLDGFLEVLSGIALAFVTQHWLFQFLFEQHVIADPNGYIGQHILNAIGQLSFGTKLFATFYLLLHGIIKLALAGAVWFNKLWAYPIVGFILSLFVIYGIIRITFTHSIALVVFMLIDILIIIMLKPEYDRQVEQKKKKNT